MQLIPYGKQTIDESDIDAVVKVLKSDYLTTGPCLEQFERRFADYLGVGHAVAVANGTAALHLAAMALDIGPGTRVLTSPVSFVATANCVLYCGGIPEFSDIEKDYPNLDPEGARDIIESSPPGTYSGIIIVNFAGQPCRMEAFRSLCNEFNLWLLEDACHSLGAMYSLQDVSRVGNGSYADLSVFSFHPVKHMTTGEGGMITTNNQGLAQKLRLLRSHGVTRNQTELQGLAHGPWYYEMQSLGYNYRLTDMQAALGLSQLSKMDQFIERRKHIARRYEQAFREAGIKFLEERSGTGHAWHIFVILTQRRAELFTHLAENGIRPQVHYIPIYKQPYFQQRKITVHKCQNSESYYSQCLTIPMYPSLSETEQDFIIEKIVAFENRWK